MADFRLLARQVPAVRDYIRHRRWVDRAGVLAYAPGLYCAAFSTDALGFRQGVLDGRRYDTGAAFDGGAYGLVLGSSHVFGFGLDGDAATIPSQLAARTGLPCLNLSFPEAQLHALHAVALRICRQAPRPPAFIALLPGGMLTRYAYVRDCDPLFGVPDFRQAARPDAGPGDPAEAAAFARLLTYTRFWIGVIADLARDQACPLVLHPEATAFEKRQLAAAEVARGLTRPQTEADRARFATHRLRYAAYDALVASAAGPAAAVVRTDPAALGYLDEFHYDADGAARIAEALARPLQSAGVAR